MPKALPKPLLSADSLFTIQGALDDRLKHLNDIHDYGATLGATDPFFTHLRAKRDATLKARNEVGALFEAQFPKS